MYTNGYISSYRFEKNYGTDDINITDGTINKNEIN